MKRILISAVLALALAGTSAFAAQNKNTAKKPAAKPAAAAATTNTGAKKPAARKRKKKAKAKADSAGTMKPAPKKGNANKK